ncbi:MAG: hypothetical protein HQL48_09645, partial [Gammaproteobacteria bacterium]|nr:hypothetical protein [Gammaproteobacteria bacterium]
DRWVERLAAESRLIWGPLFVVALLLLLWKVGRRRELRPLILLMTLLSWFVIQGVLLLGVNEGRYRKPIEGVIIAALLVGVFPSRRQREEEALPS